MPSHFINPLFIPCATRSGRNVGQRAIFCSGAPADRASEPPTVQSIARSVQPSTAVQTLTRSRKVRRGSNEEEEYRVEEKSSEEEDSVACESEDSDILVDTPEIQVKGSWEGQSKKYL